MKAETRLRKALESAVRDMADVTSEVYIQATDYQSEPVNERYAPVLRMLRRAVKRGLAVLEATKVTAPLPKEARRGH